MRWETRAVWEQHRQSAITFATLLRISRFSGSAASAGAARTRRLAGMSLLVLPSYILSSTSSGRRLHPFLLRWSHANRKPRARSDGARGFDMFSTGAGCASAEARGTKARRETQTRTKGKAAPHAESDGRRLMAHRPARLLSWKPSL
ncbi:hypothetical protein K466DRAFT_339508 [Polyporus arcularius HHB13444]|uniref:Uncharacterized protein n=1 Tax=Polyporus arcularius HHB13444 TaxID=1314778 RepID=A0A5C3NVU4_9APHY|nr:hypothetical protein K466DRAFT_339508 [Polyporus arcularius HHB13444]